MTTRRVDDASGARWAAVAQVAMALGNELSLDGIAGRIFDEALVVLGADCAALYLVDDSMQRLTLLAQRGFPEQFDRELSELPLAAPEISTKAATDRKLQLVTDTTQVPPDLASSKEILISCGYRSIVAVPLQARGELVGVLRLGTREAREFDQAAVGVIEFGAHAIATAILNTRAFTAERRMRLALQAVDEATLAIATELEPRRVLQAIVDRAREMAGARFAALGIGTNPIKQFDPWVFSGMSEEDARLIGHYPRPLGLLGAVPNEGKVIRVPDMTLDPRRCGFPPHHPTMKSFLGIPIRAGSEAIGNLYLADKIGASEFTAEDEQAASSLAAHAAIAYRHAQLFEQARGERNRLEAVVESSPLGIIFIEGDTGYVYANHAAEELFGWSLSPASGREQYLMQCHRPDDRLLEPEEVPSERALRGESVVGVELTISRPDGSKVPVLANAEPIRDGHGRVTGAVVLWQDITPLKLEQLREEFISLVAHELRAPITVIAGYADLLNRGAPADISRRATESIRISARRLERLVQDLLDASRIEARRLELERRLVQVPALVEDVVQRLSTVLSGHPIHLSVQGNPQPVDADPVRVEQVLTNLLTNAAKYSSPESATRVEVDGQPDQVVVSVSNDGPGIPPDEMPRLFTRFYRTRGAQQGKAAGIGLGLYIARGLVEAHGGQIWATSRPNEGATFSFSLPVLSVAAEERDRSES